MNGDYNEVKKQFNFVIGRSKKDNQIHGILGFIPNSHFDKKIKQIDLALALWKVREDVKAGGLGISLIRFLEMILSQEVFMVLVLILLFFQFISIWVLNLVV